ncbi:SGNH/GDSL hydrolase family protein [Domibacillus epiphyticus]|uniref:SGNH hydrolase-type esterase domain-containing protein n=1 Tax=Domibacillus epiphyticus TaxID=1714355 RepID=A0A1V2A670_9BACI|nr:SGNH/GDSL hydrolase family protein [Domibacillus epiphyticus]OMP66505.1 hypothetical protein BTO28_12485 [Domibacillus epiphyticus]
MLKRIVFLFLLITLFCMPNVQASGLNYVAIGDSVAAGQTPSREIGAGYTDMIAMSLYRAGVIDSYSKQLSIPGYTVKQVTKKVGSAAGQRVIQNSDIMTISAGANDLLPLFQYNSGSGTVMFNAITTALALDGVRENYKELLNKIYEVNPNIDVYAMGYYFPYPHVNAHYKGAVGEQLALLNEIIKQEAERAGAAFVPVAHYFGTDAVDYLPNPYDTHPAPAGYLAMANAFLDVYNPELPDIPDSVLGQLPEPVPFAE